MRIAIVAGEASGDILGAGLIQQLKTYQPDIEFSGIGGPLMCAQGFNTLFDMERLSIMGFVEPIKRLPELLRMRRTVIATCLTKQVDLFIGIDSPDFNLGIERSLKKQGIKTCHYVSPSVWAWRQGRIKTIKKSVDLVLTLLPFEADFYQNHDVDVEFVGHPLADSMPLDCHQNTARDQLNLDYDSPVIAILPGSRGGEVRLLGQLFLDVAKNIADTNGAMRFLIPAANEERMQQLHGMLEAMPDHFQQKVRLVLKQSHTVMAASDTILLASGTTALEAMLLKKPMLVAYKLAPLSYAIVSRLIRCPYVSLPNLLANKPLVTELLQADATVDNLTAALTQLVDDQSMRQQQIQAFYQLHHDIQRHADERAASAIWKLLNE